MRTKFAGIFPQNPAWAVIILKKFPFFFALLLSFTLSMFLPLSRTGPESEPNSRSATAPAGQPNPLSGKLTVRIAAFGDIMMHRPQIRAGTKPDGRLDFRPFFREVKPYIENADLAIGNLETTLAGKSRPYSGYPRFNAPDELAAALKESGVDLVSTANNHAMDSGAAGVIRTWQTLRKTGILPVGTAPSPGERKPVLVKKNGITLAFLAYTQTTNGLPVPKEKPWLVDRIVPGQIARDIQAARKQGADFICVSLHFGTEYQRRPNEYQKNAVRQVLSAGADAVLGSHPHVLQPIEIRKHGGREKAVIYSMGNFISNQQDPYTDEGVIIYLDVEKDVQSGQTRLKSLSWLPTFVHQYSRGGKKQYVVIPMVQPGPAKLPAYPGLTRARWKTAWVHTESLIRERANLPVFSPANP